MHIPRSERGQNGTVIILSQRLHAPWVWLVIAGSFQLLSSHHTQSPEQMDGLDHRLFCCIYL